MSITREDIAKAREWLHKQRQVITPGPIQVCLEGLDALEGPLLRREQQKMVRAITPKYSDR